MSEMVLRNARIVLADEVVTGSVLVADGKLSAIDAGSAAHGEDFDGDFLIPGLVELHTDHFESHYRPRPAVTLNALAALQAHDAQVAGAGITTVFDAVRIGSDAEMGDITLPPGTSAAGGPLSQTSAWAAPLPNRASAVAAAASGPRIVFIRSSPINPVCPWPCRR